MKKIVYVFTICFLMLSVGSGFSQSSLTLEESNITFTETSPIQVGVVGLSGGDLKFTLPGSPGSIFSFNDEGSITFQNISDNKQVDIQLTDNGVLKFLGGIYQVMTFAVDSLGRMAVGNEDPDDEAQLLIKSQSSTSINSLRHQNEFATWDIRVDGAGDYNWYENSSIGSYIDKSDGYAYKTFSDKRLKSDIESMSPMLKKILQLRPVKYYLRGNTEKKSPKTIGFIAQEVEELFPELVSEKNGFKTLAYAHYSILAIKAIQEQQLIIEDQKSEYQILSDKYLKLESKIKDIEDRMKISEKTLVNNNSRK